MTGGKIDVGVGRPIVFAKFGRFRLLAIEGELLEIMEALKCEISDKFF